MDPADDLSDLSHLCSSAVDSLKKFKKLLNNKLKPEEGYADSAGNAVVRGCGASRSRQPQQKYSCSKGDTDAACQQCDSMIPGSAVATSEAKRQQRWLEKKLALCHQKKASGPQPLPTPPQSELSLAGARNNAASSSSQLMRLQQTELRLILKLDTWMASDGSLVVRPSLYEDRAVSTGGSKTEELGAQRFSALAAEKQLQLPRGPAAPVNVAGNHCRSDSGETDNRKIVIPLFRQQLLLQKQLQSQSQQQQHQLQQLKEARQQQQKQKQQQPLRLRQQHQSHYLSPANLVQASSLRNVSNNSNGVTLPSKAIFLPVFTGSAKQSAGDQLQTSGVSLYKRSGTVDSFQPHVTASCLCDSGANDHGCCQVNNHHDNTNSESDNLSDQSDAINHSFGSEYSSRK